MSTTWDLARDENHILDITESSSRYTLNYIDIKSDYQEIPLAVVNPKMLQRIIDAARTDRIVIFDQIEGYELFEVTGHLTLNSHRGLIAIDVKSHDGTKESIRIIGYDKEQVIRICTHLLEDHFETEVKPT